MRRSSAACPRRPRPIEEPNCRVSWVIDEGAAIIAEPASANRRLPEGPEAASAAQRDPPRQKEWLTIAERPKGPRHRRQARHPERDVEFPPGRGAMALAGRRRRRGNPRPAAARRERSSRPPRPSSHGPAPPCQPRCSRLERHRTVRAAGKRDRPRFGLLQAQHSPPMWPAYRFRFASAAAAVQNRWKASRPVAAGRRSRSPNERAHVTERGSGHGET